MNRRDALAMLGGTLFLGGAPATRAQTRHGVHRIGSLGLGVLPSPADLQRGWAPARALGWVEGQNIIVERRYAGGDADLLPRYAEELVRLNVETILPGRRLRHVIAECRNGKRIVGIHNRWRCALPRDSCAPATPAMSNSTHQPRHNFPGLTVPVHAVNQAIE